MYDFAGPLFRGFGNASLCVATEEIIAQPIGNGHSRQAGEFAQGVGPLDQGNLGVAAGCEAARLETQHCLFSRIATSHAARLENWFAGILNEKTPTMFHIILFQPEIPPNTGNVIRLAANTGCTLHLVKPLGFDIDDRSLRRAGLDYAEFVAMAVHDNWEACRMRLGHRRLFAVSTRATVRHDTVAFEPGDAFVFGQETAGLPAEMLDGFPAQRCLRLPMIPGNRSLNLSNAVAVLVFEAWRQQGFAGGQ